MPHPLDQWLSYRDRVPLEVTALSSIPAADELHQWHDADLRVLAAVATLDEAYARADAGGSGDDAEIDRLHQKIDLVLDLLATLVRGLRSHAAEVPVLLSKEGLAWPQSWLDLAVGSWVRVELELHPSAPQRLVWAAEVVAHQDGEVCAKFLTPPEALDAALERYVFRRHRRSVAEARSPAGKP
ncbi:PilZ domain-containing protein [Sinimarinibacterium sp. CAU 1509]|uniref:PilZ domain-containing protein n=1 Tax=Sinimarinibacterium sp. CAU 1509 TaxID=2562283 RepID=UPI00146E704F|nr:PilZ domain-containing protein [Sinimarinibacterium sp. CAU 1509]